MRVFLNANVLVAIGFRPMGDYRRIFNFAGIAYVSTDAILREVANNLVDLGKDPVAFIQTLRERIEIVDASGRLPAGLALRAPEDREALSAAIGSNCDEFVTFDDRDFAPIYGTSIEGTVVRHAAEFIRRHSVREPAQTY